MRNCQEIEWCLISNFDWLGHLFSGAIDLLWWFRHSSIRCVASSPLDQIRASAMSSRSSFPLMSLMLNIANQLNLIEWRVGTVHEPKPVKKFNITVSIQPHVIHWPKQQRFRALKEYKETFRNTAFDASAVCTTSGNHSEHIIIRIGDPKMVFLITHNFMGFVFYIKRLF